jgi:hypothetical protein
LLGWDSLIDPSPDDLKLHISRIDSKSKQILEDKISFFQLNSGESSKTWSDLSTQIDPFIADEFEYIISEIENLTPADSSSSTILDDQFNSLSSNWSVVGPTPNYDPQLNIRVEGGFLIIPYRQDIYNGTSRGVKSTLSVTKGKLHKLSLEFFLSNTSQLGEVSGIVKIENGTEIIEKTLKEILSTKKEIFFTSKSTSVVISIHSIPSTTAYHPTNNR